MPAGKSLITHARSYRWIFRRIALTCFCEAVSMELKALPASLRKELTDEVKWAWDVNHGLHLC